MSIAIESGRGGFGHGYVAFSWADLKSACELYGFSPKPWQLRALRQMESVWLTHRNKSKSVSSVPLTPNLFDAMFIPQKEGSIGG